MKKLKLLQKVTGKKIKNIKTTVPPSKIKQLLNFNVSVINDVALFNRAEKGRKKAFNVKRIIS